MRRRSGTAPARRRPARAISRSVRSVGDSGRDLTRWSSSADAFRHGTMHSWPRARVARLDGDQQLHDSRGRLPVQVDRHAHAPAACRSDRTSPTFVVDPDHRLPADQIRLVGSSGAARFSAFVPLDDSAPAAPASRSAAATGLSRSTAEPAVRPVGCRGGELGGQVCGRVRPRPGPLACRDRAAPAAGRVAARDRRGPLQPRRRPRAGRVRRRDERRRRAAARRGAGRLGLARRAGARLGDRRGRASCSRSSRACRRCSACSASASRGGSTASSATGSPPRRSGARRSLRSRTRSSSATSARPAGTSSSTRSRPAGRCPGSSR